LKKFTKNDKDIYIDRTSALDFEIEALKGRNVFTVDISFPSSKAYRDSAIGVFDTGASNTIISMKALYKNLTDKQYNILKNALVNNGTTKREFSSAKNNDKNSGDIEAFYCTLPSIKIPERDIKDFPFYMMDDRERSLILIGYDFISSCDTVQLRNGNMYFYNFDIGAMQNKMKGDNPLNLLSISI